jgi:hypothetical protein
MPTNPQVSVQAQTILIHFLTIDHYSKIQILIKTKTFILHKTTLTVSSLTHHSTLIQYLPTGCKLLFISQLKGLVLVKLVPNAVVSVNNSTFKIQRNLSLLQGSRSSGKPYLNTDIIYTNWGKQWNREMLNVKSILLESSKEKLALI